MIKLFKPLFSRFRERWGRFSPAQKRFFFLSLFLSGFTLAALELVVWWYGGDPSAPFLSLPPFLQLLLPPSFGVSESLTFRQTGILVRVVLLVLWSYYVSYQLAIRPVLSIATSDYQELCKTLPAPLAILRAFRTSPEFNRVVVVLASVTVVVVVARWGPMQGVGVGLLPWIATLLSCYFQFKAGRYPGSEQEFWGEVAEGSGQYGKQLGRTAALAVGAAGIMNAGVEWYKVHSNNRIAEQQLADKADARAQKFADRADARALERERIAFEERKWSAEQAERNKQNGPPAKKGIFG